MKTFQSLIAAASLVAVLTGPGCADQSSAAPLVSAWAAANLSVPTVRAVVANHVIAASVDKSPEGLIISSTLVDVALPTVASFGGTSIVVAGKDLTTSDGGATWTHASSGDGDAARTLGSSMSDADMAWYLAAIQAPTAGDTAEGLTGINSSDDSVWTAQRNLAQAFLVRKILDGTEASHLNGDGATWVLNPARIDTGVDTSWALDTYLARWIEAYKKPVVSSDGDSAASEAE